MSEEVKVLANMNFVLTKQARKTGGDRYECTLSGAERPMVVYVPQSISREGIIVHKRLNIRIGIATN